VAHNTRRRSAGEAGRFFSECDSYRPYAGKLVRTIECEAHCVCRDWAARLRQSDYFEGG
jgi:hypothetical protein